MTTQLDPFDAQDLALQIHMRWDFDDVAPGVLDELADAVLAWTEEPELEEIVTRAVAHCWSPALEQDLRDSLSGLADASPGCRHRARLALAGLDEAAVLQLVHAVAGADAPPSLVNDLRDRTGGNPFFVREVAQLHRLQGGGGFAVPPGVRQALGRRLARLPQPTPQRS